LFHPQLITFKVAIRIAWTGVRRLEGINDESSSISERRPACIYKSFPERKSSVGKDSFGESLGPKVDQCVAASHEEGWLLAQCQRQQVSAPMKKSRE